MIPSLDHQKPLGNMEGAKYRSNRLPTKLEGVSFEPKGNPLTRTLNNWSSLQTSVTGKQQQQQQQQQQQLDITCYMPSQLVAVIRSTKNPPSPPDQYDSSV